MVKIILALALFFGSAEAVYFSLSDDQKKCEQWEPPAFFFFPLFSLLQSCALLTTFFVFFADAFEEFKREHNKKYDSEEEEKRRFENFVSTLRREFSIIHHFIFMRKNHITFYCSLLFVLVQ